MSDDFRKVSAIVRKYRNIAEQNTDDSPKHSETIADRKSENDAEQEKENS